MLDLIAILLILYFGFKMGHKTSSSGIKPKKVRKGVRVYDPKNMELVAESDYRIRIYGEHIFPQKSWLFKSKKGHFYSCTYTKYLFWGGYNWGYESPDHLYSWFDKYGVPIPDWYKLEEM